MALFKNSTHQAIWMESHCGRCWHGTRDCPILAWALAHDRKPKAWDRNPKAQLMKDTIRCNEETQRAPRVTKRVVDEDVPMFDVTPVVQRSEVDHA